MRSLIADYSELVKPRIALMVLLTVVVAALLVAGGQTSIPAILYVSIGVGLISASGSAWNQYLERYTDYLMPRTARRPLPEMRLSANQVAIFGAITFGTGLGFLAAVVGYFATILALATWILYVVIYTPLKRRTWWNTAIGAIAGAMPVLIGALGGAGRITLLVWGLFAILFLWQFPHFMAIAWLYRRDYAEGGLQMISVVDPSGRLAGIHAIVGAAALLLVSIATGFAYPAGLPRGLVIVLSAVAGVWFLAKSIQFAKRLDDPSARSLLRASLIHLPLVLFALVVARLIE